MTVFFGGLKMKGLKFLGALALSIFMCSACSQQNSAATPIGIAVIQAQDGRLLDGQCVTKAVQDGTSIGSCPTYQANNTTMGSANPAELASGLVAEKCNCNLNNWWNYYNNPSTYNYYYAVYNPYYVPANTFTTALGLNSSYAESLYSQLGYNTSQYNIYSFGYPGYNYSNFAYTTNYNTGSQWWNYYWWI